MLGYLSCTCPVLVRYLFGGCRSCHTENHPLLFRLRRRKNIRRQLFTHSSRLAEELHYRSYLCSGEHLDFLLIPLGHHGLPHTARLVHLLTEEAHLAPKQKFNKVKFFSYFIFQTIMHSRPTNEARAESSSLNHCRARRRKSKA